MGHDRRLGHLVAALVAAAALAACDDGGDADAGPDAGAAPVDASARDASDSDVVASDASVPSDASAPSDGSAPTDASAPSDASVPSDATAPSDASVSADAGVDPADAGAPDAGCDRDGDGHDGPSCGGADCDDADPAVHPGATEVCDGDNDDCDADTDEGVLLTFYADADGDGYGDPSGATTTACAAPDGFRASATDCDDTHALVYPGALAPCGCVTPALYDVDTDGSVSSSCGGDDCDDADEASYLGAPERCDRIDNDCSLGGGTDASEDVDDDGHAPLGATCSGGFALDDCDDARTATHPGASEACNLIDDDCAGGVDDGAAASCVFDHGTGACEAGGCALLSCDPGYVPSGSACIATLAPRPIAPLSGATATTRRPLLRWVLAEGTNGARIELCADRACASPIATLDVTGASVAPTEDLPPGVVFWRLRGRTDGTLHDGVSATWQLTVPARSAPVDASWGSIFDANGDGYADVAASAPEAGAGRVQVYYGSAAGIASTPTTTLVGPGGTNGLFGAGVASADVDGDGFSDLVVGATQIGSNRGLVYVYPGGPSGLASAPATAISPPEGSGNVFFGAPIASAGDVDGDGYADVVIAATGLDVGFDDGRAYVFAGGPTGLSAAPAAALGPLVGDNGFGLAALGCDLDADGYTDVIVGSDIRSSSDGRFSVYVGGPSGVSVAADRTVLGLGEIGSALACADVDGDGYPDLAAGAPQERAVHLFTGGPSGIGASATATITPPSVEFDFGHALGTGDVDGDGYADLAVGAPSASGGRVHLFAGGASGLSPAPARTIEAAALSDRLGSSVAGGGDVNGDGWADVVAGAPNVEPDQRGAAYVFLGSAGGLAVEPPVTLAGTVDDAELGTVVVE